MKIKSEHLEHMRSKINLFLRDNPYIIEKYEKGEFTRSDKIKDLQKRFCFDMAFISGLTTFICEELYSYVNNDHIYTALKLICPKINKRY
jgi:hypothetical protein